MPRTKPLTVDQEIEYEIQLDVDRLIADLNRKRIDRKALMKLSGTSSSALTQQLQRGTMTFKVYKSWQRLKKEREK